VYNAFDDAQEGNRKGALKPFWTLDFDDEKALLAWLNAEYEFRKEQAQDRILIQRKNLAAYRGIHYQSQSPRNREIDTAGPIKTGKHQKIVINHMIDMVEQDVSRLTKYRGAVSAIPPSQDWDDRVVCGIGEDLIEAKWEKEEIDFIYQKLHRQKRIFGEAFLLTLWNPHLGHFHPDYVAEVFARAGIKKNPEKLSKGEIRDIFRKEIKEIPRLPLLDEKGEQLTSGSGDLLWIDRPVRVGDIQYKLVFSWDMFLERKNAYEDVDNGFYRECMHIEDVKADHPDCAEKLKPDANYQWFDPESLEDRDMSNHTEVVHFYHRGTSRLGQGRYVKFTKDAILVNKPNDDYVGPDGPILPWERISDIDTPAVLNGESFVTHGRPAQAIYNQVVSMRVRNQYLFAHPKWFFVKNSVKPESLGNDSTLVPVAAGAPNPTLAQPALASSEQSALRSEAKEDLQQMMGVYSVSRGEVPTGVTAASALMFLDEQESDRANPGVASHTRHQRMVALRTVWLMADHYDDTDGRLEELLGRTRADEVKHFKMADLTRIADIRIKNDSALPQQKAAKMQYVTDMKKNFPTILPDDHVVDILGLGDDTKFQNSVTVSIRAAESENDTMIRTGMAPSPEKWENHLTHYRIHSRAMNEPSYRSMPRRVKDAFKDHARATEMLMLDVMKVNPAFAQAVLTEFPQFPVFFTEAAVFEPMPLDAEGMAGAAVTESPVSGLAPVAPPPPLPPDALPPGLEAQLPQSLGASPGAGLELPLGAVNV
jgi:hypothetical protein